MKRIRKTVWIHLGPRLACLALALEGNLIPMDANVIVINT